MYSFFSGLLKEDILAQCLIFFLAGYSTVADAASFAMYNLATNPDCQERAFQEILDVLQDKVYTCAVVPLFRGRLNQFNEFINPGEFAIWYKSIHGLIIVNLVHLQILYYGFLVTLASLSSSNVKYV